MNAMSIPSAPISSTNVSKADLREAVSVYDEACARLEALMVEVEAAKQGKTDAVLAIAALHGYKGGSDKAPKVQFKHPTTGAFMTLVIKASRAAGRLDAFFRSPGDPSKFADLND